MKTNRIIIISSLVFLTLAIFVTHIYVLNNKCNTSNFKYLNPDLVCRNDFVVSKKAYASLKSSIKDIIDIKIKDKEITNASIYFRDLQNGPTFGINEYEKFSPASLLKLPLLITYLNLQDDNPNLLQTQIGFDNVEDSLEQYFPSKISATQNTPYKIQDLLSYMIQYSDNNSYYALREYLKVIDPRKDLLQQTFIDLGIIDPKDFTDQTISVKAYSSIFIQLYYNSFLTNNKLSEEALDMLAKSDFDKGIVQGLPVGIQVAHKFGEREDLPNGEKQLHDCGIVYYSNNPYLLCVMTRGKDFDKLSSFIGLISEMVYKEFDSRKL